METINVLLSDEYVEFTQKIVELAGKKKEAKAEIKALMEGIKQLDQEALDLQAEFEKWKAEKVK